MDTDIKKLQPEKLWSYFYQLTQIPRSSHFEEKAVEFIKKFGELNRLETIVDKTGNVVIRKPASKGFENLKGVILQAHLDMVAQKLTESNHNFTIDPIHAIIDGGWVKADKTTLGADNGIGVAAILAILSSKDIVHGPLEALFTIGEEVGMIGASRLESKLLKGEILINLDSESEGELYIGCAGGADTKAIFKFEKVKAPSGYKSMKICIKGLRGGHSGLDIQLKRGNANKMLNRILLNANQHLGVILASIEGGKLRNTIPSESTAIIALPGGEVNNLFKFTKEIEEYYKKTLADEKDFHISIEEVEMPLEFIDFETLDSFLNAVHLAQNGVLKMSRKFKNVVETSTNLAIIKSENNKITVSFFHRSSSDLAKKELCRQTEELFAKYGAEVETCGNSPGWKPDPGSPILKLMKTVYHSAFGKNPKIKVIHAGLECGVIFSKYPHFDMISIGPEICNPHTVDEKVNIKSVEKFYLFLSEVLKKIPAK